MSEVAERVRRALEQGKLVVLVEDARRVKPAPEHAEMVEVIEA